MWGCCGLECGFLVIKGLDGLCGLLFCPFRFVGGRESKRTVSFLHFRVREGYKGVRGGVSSDWGHHTMQTRVQTKNKEYEL